MILPVVFQVLVVHICLFLLLSCHLPAVLYCGTHNDTSIMITMQTAAETWGQTRCNVCTLLHVPLHHKKHLPQTNFLFNSIAFLFQFLLFVLQLQHLVFCLFQCSHMSSIQPFKNFILHIRIDLAHNIHDAKPNNSTIFIPRAALYLSFEEHLSLLNDCFKTK